MKTISSFIVLAIAAAAVAGCSTYDSYYGSQAAYYPAGTTYSSTPTYYAYDPPNYQRSNVYSSRWDYYRNYQGIHGGPERTGP
jgi:hypothetical protein